MNLFMTAVVTPPEHLPITASDTDLAAAVTEEIERGAFCGGLSCARSAGS